MSSMSETDYKAKCEELSKRNTELTAEVKSLEAVCQKLQLEVRKWKHEFDNTVTIHNDIRDKMMVVLSEGMTLTSGSKFLNSSQLEQLHAQEAAAQQKPQAN